MMMMKMMVSCTRTQKTVLSIWQNPLRQFPGSKSATSLQYKLQARNKYVTSCREQKSVVSVVSCRFPNSITTTCCQLVADKSARQQGCNKLATSP